jgi:NAD(P)-dependent dehydrogenase (short-subunit alcohol dehydrogenase family)
MFSFGKSKTEARIVGEFYRNAIHVMEGASVLDEGLPTGALPQCGPESDPASFKVLHNYVALPPSEAFRIEYWAMEDAKLRRQPAEKELSRRIALVVGGGVGMGREAALLAAARGAHVVVADLDEAVAQWAAKELESVTTKECIASTRVDIRSRASIAQALRATVAAFGGIDILINTAAYLPSPVDGVIPDEQWGVAFDCNVTANYILADEAAKVFAEQSLDGAIVFVSSANAVAANHGSEAFDVSKAALSHLVRELAVALSPKVRVNAISPATAMRGSAKFPRDRARATPSTQNLPAGNALQDEDLRGLLSSSYAERSLTHQAAESSDCAEAILFLASPRARCTSGHLIPVDGGLTEAFLR